MMKCFSRIMTLLAALLLLAAPGMANDSIDALIVDGQNNHDWEATTPVMEQILANTGRFDVDVATADDVSEFRPAFADYQVVVLNYNGEPWPEETQQDFVEYVDGGGGVVVVHAADNSFPEWEAYNRIIGLGGWGGRDEGHGPYVYYNEDEELVRDDSPGRGGAHGPQKEFALQARQPDHPIMEDLPERWMHPQDEIYNRLRGPAENLAILATAWSDDSGRHEPQLMTIEYGGGRVFHAAPGHGVEAMHGLGFQAAFQRGAEWAATGEVTIPAPDSDELPAEGEPATRNPADIPTVAEAEADAETEDEDEDRPHVVFVTGDEEYRSEESMPMLARILNVHHDFEVSVCYALTDGVIDPNQTENIEGLEVLEDADMMVMFTRFRQLPDDQLQYIVDFAESGRPMAGFRTATHAFRYGEDHPNQHMDSEWPHEVFGLPWISHHGHENSTDVFLEEDREDHPVLNGVEPFHARSWLYDSEGRLHENAEPLLYGRAVEGAEAGGEHFSDPHAIAWTHTYEGEEGDSRVFFTTLGHPFDFFEESMRKLSVNGIFWALGMEDEIPEDGLNVDFVHEYDPNDSGFGDEYKPDMRPEDIPLGE